MEHEIFLYVLYQFTLYFTLVCKIINCILLLIVRILVLVYDVQIHQLSFFGRNVTDF